MDIVLISDNNYIKPMMVLMRSIICTNDVDNTNFHLVLNGDIRYDTHNMLNEFITQNNISARFYKLDISKLPNLPVGRKDQPMHISVSAYFRLFLTDILPDGLQRVLYMDCDIIVRSSLKELWDMDLEEYSVGCVSDMNEGDISRYNYLRYSPRYGYFNSGVLLINLDYWRKHDLKNRFVNFIKTFPERLVMHDQDVLNYILHDSNKRVPIKYNVQSGFLLSRVNISWEYEEELIEALETPCIIHYTNWIKPWFRNCDNPWASEWLKYYHLMPFALHKLPVLRYHRSLKSRLKSLLLKFHILKNNNPYRTDICILS